MKVTNLSGFVQCKTLASPTLTLALSQLMTLKKSTKKVQTQIRGIGKPLNEIRLQRLPSLRLKSRKTKIKLVHAFGRKPIKHSTQLPTNTHQKKESKSNTSEESQDSEKLGSNIPWGKGKIIEVMCLWFVSFVFFRSSIWKLGMWVLGIASEAELSASGQAAFTLGLDFSMLGTTVFILRRCLREYKPLTKRGLFRLSLKGKWWIILLLSCLCIPAIDWLGTRMAVWFPEDIDFSNGNVAIQLSRGNLLPNLLYFILLSLCAPIWEELMFRGFLLPSLGKFLPSALAISASAAIFALMHGNLRQFLPLWVLGMIIGNAFVRSNNLLPAILLHSLYNCYVFVHVLFGI